MNCTLTARPLRCGTYCRFYLLCLHTLTTLKILNNFQLYCLANMTSYLTKSCPEGEVVASRQLDVCNRIIDISYLSYVPSIVCFRHFRELIGHYGRYLVGLLLRGWNITLSPHSPEPCLIYICSCEEGRPRLRLVRLPPTDNEMILIWQVDWQLSTGVSVDKESNSNPCGVRLDRPNYVVSERSTKGEINSRKPIFHPI